MKVKTTMEPTIEIEVDGAAYRRLKNQGLIHEVVEPKPDDKQEQDAEAAKKAAAAKSAFLPTVPAPSAVVADADEAQASDKKVGA